ncbi:CDC48 family AAA ATPase [Candidatus Parcubacteria bacterium]|nr:CDC48 family AAA ATPase [Candidatus Parcubacteria bacterium]
MPSNFETGAKLLLKVAEARARDVGRGIGRIDPNQLKRLNLEIGDVCQVTGKKKTVIKLMPTFAEDRGQGIIQIDGITRENAKIGLDEKVKVQKVAYNQAKTVVLSPITLTSSLPTEEDREYLAQLLDGTPVTKNDKIRVTFFGTRSQDFLVEETDPGGAVLIISDTLVKIKGAGKITKKGVGVTYEDIGGLKKEIGKIREMIELPLKYPEVFERLGVSAPKGVLLYGPPGCGKTLIAKAVANETDAYFTSISGPEIMGKFYGESEGRLREVFEEAQSNIPAILVIDEIDAIAPKREDMGGEKQVERRVVAQLLALMDGLESRGNLVVIGITNIPNTLDPALRRPGRFDREISVPIPDKNERKEILEIYTRGMPLARTVDLEKLAEITHGFVGADLEALAREAAMSALRKVLPEIEFSAQGGSASGGEKGYIPYKKLLGLEVTMDHFREALKEVEPSALREVFTEIPNVRWEDVGGLEEIKQTLKETIEWPLKYEKLFDHSKTKPPKGILLYGLPGTGKTLIAKAVATEAGVNFISVKGPQLLSKYIGESERAVREVFKKAKQASPCIVFFDELDSLVPTRSGSTDSQVIERVVSQFLTELDGVEELKGVVVLGATNRLDLIDPALLRAGRFDFLLEMPKPNEKTRKEIFRIHTKGKPLVSDVNLNSLAKDTEGLTGSDIEAICRKASFLAIREFLAQESRAKKSELSDFKITTKHFKKAMA